MPGISREVMAHKFNVNPSMCPVKQKRRVFAPKRNASVMEEVEKLLTVDSLRKSTTQNGWPMWLWLRSPENGGCVSTSPTKTKHVLKIFTHCHG